eukprot:Pompholyxophrys_punicea_v1_NODE_331_length_2234_cov_5.731651.p2 type:complete len:114 gc:universal NODE_331_length_2234_cov_5.731651:630-971(+)
MTVWRAKVQEQQVTVPGEQRSPIHRVVLKVLTTIVQQTIGRHPQVSHRFLLYSNQLLSVTLVVQFEYMSVFRACLHEHFRFYITRASSSGQIYTELHLGICAKYGRELNFANF